MKVARDRAELARLLPMAQHEATMFSGRGDVYTRTLPRPPASYRDPDPRRRPGRCGSSRRARLLKLRHLAPRRCSRSIAVAGAERGGAQPGRRARRGCHARSRLSQRRHPRIPLSGRRVLLHRDEYAAAGRAPDQRNGQRHRYRLRAAAHCGRRSARLSPGRDPPLGSRDRMPHQRREPRNLPGRRPGG